MYADPPNEPRIYVPEDNKVLVSRLLWSSLRLASRGCDAELYPTMPYLSCISERF